MAFKHHTGLSLVFLAMAVVVVAGTLSDGDHEPCDDVRHPVRCKDILPDRRKRSTPFNATVYIFDVALGVSTTAQMLIRFSNVSMSKDTSQECMDSYDKTVHLLEDHSEPYDSIEGLENTVALIRNRYLDCQKHFYSDPQPAAAGKKFPFTNLHELIQNLVDLATDFINRLKANAPAPAPRPSDPCDDGVRHADLCKSTVKDRSNTYNAAISLFRAAIDVVKDTYLRLNKTSSLAMAPQTKKICGERYASTLNELTQYVNKGHTHVVGKELIDGIVEAYNLFGDCRLEFQGKPQPAKEFPFAHAHELFDNLTEVGRDLADNVAKEDAKHSGGHPCDGVRHADLCKSIVKDTSNTYNATISLFRVAIDVAHNTYSLFKNTTHLAMSPQTKAECNNNYNDTLNVLLTVDLNKGHYHDSGPKLSDQLNLATSHFSFTRDCNTTPQPTGAKFPFTDPHQLFAKLGDIGQDLTEKLSKEDKLSK